MPTMTEWECGSCDAITDRTVAEIGDLYHHPDEDCRAVRAFDAAEWHDEHDERYHAECSTCQRIQSEELERYRPRVVQAPLTREEIEAMNADRELMLDETHGRGFE